MYMNERRITYKSARVKGKQLERDVAKALFDIGINAKRVPMSGALAWLKGDVAELDTTGRQSIHIHECKNHETLCLPEWWRQAKDESTKGEIPALHFRSNRRGIFTVMRCEEFDDLVFEYEESKPELTLNLIDMPTRRNFWKFYDENLRSPIDMFLTEIDGDEVTIVSFDLYLKLRKVVTAQAYRAKQPILPQDPLQPDSQLDTPLVKTAIA